MNHRANGFTRLFFPHAISSVRSMDLQYNSFYIAGMTANRIYLGNTQSPLLLVVVNTSLKDTTHLYLNVDSTERRKLQSVNIEVDSPNIVIKDGISPTILRGDLKTMAMHRYMYDSCYFTAAISVGQHSFALRTSRNGVREYVLAKEQADLPHLRFVPGIFERQVDGFFSTDGMFLFNKDSSRLFYMYYYRNQFICLDSNLSVLYKGKTIDTTSWAKLKIAQVNNNKTFMLSSPPLKVNNKGCTAGDLIFIHSRLAANNEVREKFDAASAIDVYDIKRGVYKFSFYVYDFGGKKITDMAVKGNNLVTMQDRYIVVSQIDSKRMQLIPPR